MENVQVLLRQGFNVYILADVPKSVVVAFTAVVDACTEVVMHKYAPM